MSQSSLVQTYLDLLDVQREAAIGNLNDLTYQQLWQRPQPKEWCIGEILNHNVLLFRSMFQWVEFSWRYFRWSGKLLRSRKYRTDIDDPYRKEKFPMWTGFLWAPKYTPDNPAPLESLVSELRDEHHKVRQFFTGKDEAMLGNVFLFDPLFGFINLIVTLRIGIYHDQLHYEEVISMAVAFTAEGS